MAASQYSKTYNSFSGVDILPIFGGHVIGECQGISFTTTREKAPLYVMGSADPRSFSRGKRGIAGSMVLLVFDRSALIASMQKDAFFWGRTTEKREVAEDAKLRSRLMNDEETAAKQANPYGWKTSMNAWYHDQIPPFDIVLSACNEYGHAAKMEIRGVEILNIGSGVSVDDITTDESATYVARSIVPWGSTSFAIAADNPDKNRAEASTSDKNA